VPAQSGVTILFSGFKLRIVDLFDDFFLLSTIQDFHCMQLYDGPKSSMNHRFLKVVISM
jgi:hypothetical protein